MDCRQALTLLCATAGPSSSYGSSAGGVVAGVRSQLSREFWRAAKPRQGKGPRPVLVGRIDIPRAVRAIAEAPAIRLYVNSLGWPFSHVYPRTQVSKEFLGHWNASRLKVPIHDVERINGNINIRLNLMFAPRFNAHACNCRSRVAKSKLTFHISVGHRRN